MLKFSFASLDSCALATCVGDLKLTYANMRMHKLATLEEEARKVIENEYLFDNCVLGLFHDATEVFARLYNSFAVLSNQYYSVYVSNKVLLYEDEETYQRKKLQDKLFKRTIKYGISGQEKITRSHIMSEANAELATLIDKGQHEFEVVCLTNYFEKAILENCKRVCNIINILWVMIDDFCGVIWKLQLTELVNIIKSEEGISIRRFESWSKGWYSGISDMESHARGRIAEKADAKFDQIKIFMSSTITALRYEKEYGLLSDCMRVLIEDNRTNSRNKKWETDLLLTIAKRGWFNILQDLMKSSQDDTLHTHILCSLMAKHGHLDALRWARSANNGFKVFYWDEFTCANAAANGHLEVLTWLHENGCPWNNNTTLSAAKHGHLEILLWARINGCPWDEWTCANAALGGHLEILQYLRANGCPWDFNVCDNAATRGHLEVLQWAREGEAEPCPWSKNTCLIAAENGHLHVLRWARENGCPCDKWTCARAAFGGYIEIIKYLRSEVQALNGTTIKACSWDSNVCADAAFGGQLEVLKWLRNKTNAEVCPWDASVCARAAYGGHLEVLKWLRTNGCPWDSAVCANATNYKHIEILRWARSKNNGVGVCPWDERTRKNAAKYLNYVEE